MPKGGARVGAGRKPKPKLAPAASESVAGEVLASLGKEWKHAKDCGCEKCIWRGFVYSSDPNLAFRAMVNLTDRRDGKPTQVVRAEVSGSQGGPLVLLTSIQRPAPVRKFLVNARP
jgi:hypothetical protein